MAASQTIADSKRAFHQAFPHVIAPLYRRLADELLVELHLLSHQSRFEANELFSVGLCTVFDTFTKGYRPEAQTEALFSALCSSNGFDAAKLRKTNASLADQAKGKDLESLKSLLSSHSLNEGSHYSRLMAVGLMSLLKAAAADDMAPFDRLMSVLSQPYSLQKGAEAYAQPAPGDFGKFVTFCGT